MRFEPGKLIFANFCPRCLRIDVVRHGREEEKQMVHFVGAGPGAADLITVRGGRLIREADVIIFAGSLVNPGILEENARSGAQVYDSAEMTLEEVLDVMQRAERAGLVTVRLHTGDPCIYGAMREQMDLLEKEGIPYDYTPGVSAFCGAASALDMEYTLPGDLSNTVFNVSRSKDENDNFTTDVKFTGGRVSFAEPGESNSGSTLQTSASPTDYLRNYVFENVDAILPSIAMRGGTAGGLIHFKGGKCDVVGNTSIYTQRRSVPGSAEFRVSDGAQVTHRAYAFTIGTTEAGLANTNYIVATGAGTKFSMLGVGNLNGYGISFIVATNGATFEMGKPPASNRY